VGSRVRGQSRPPASNPTNATASTELGLPLDSRDERSGGVGDDRTNNARSWLRTASPVAVGILLSAGVSVVLALVASTVVLIGFCAALLGTTIALVYDLTRRFETRNDLEDQRSVLMAAVDDHPWLLSELMHIAVGAGTVLRRPGHAPLFIDLMKAEIGRTRSFVEDISRGHLRVPSGNVTHMSEQIDLVTESLLATTIPESDASWWLSAGGQDYLDRNRRAIDERHVRIDRIILWRVLDENLAEIVTRQLNAGVNVYYVERSTLPVDLNVSIAIYDRTIVHDVVFNSDGHDVWYAYSFDTAAAAQACDTFARIMRQASPIPPSDLAPLLPRPGLRQVGESEETPEPSVPKPQSSPADSTDVSGA
jgi:hypothetical protein